MTDWLIVWAVVAALVMGGGTILAFASDDDGTGFRAWCARVALAAPLWPLLAVGVCVVVVVARLWQVARHG